MNPTWEATFKQELACGANLKGVVTHSKRYDSTWQMFSLDSTFQSTKSFYVKHTHSGYVKIGMYVETVKCQADSYCDIKVFDSQPTSNSGDKNVNGKLYKGVVTNTKKIAAGEGVAASVDKSEIVHETGYFVSPNDDMARATILAEASLKAKLDLNDPTNVIEVHLK